MTIPASAIPFRVGDSIKPATVCDRLPAGTIVGFAHPIYQGPQAAVRVAIADGSLHWQATGFDGLVSTKDIKQRFGWAPFVILALPDEPNLNTEVRVGYRTFGPARDWRTDPAATCVQCGEPRGGIRTEGLHCVAMECGEVVHEFPRHRFRPWTTAEQARIDADEEAINQQMADMADWLRTHDTKEEH